MYGRILNSLGVLIIYSTHKSLYNDIFKNDKNKKIKDYRSIFD